MGEWQRRILNSFQPGVSRLTLVADPDGLIREERMLEEIRQRGFEILLYEDPVSFRYVYEAKYRYRWDMGERLEVIVLCPFSLDELKQLPYDVIRSGRIVSFHLAELFPQFSYQVIRELDSSDYARLYQISSDFNGPATDVATCDFLLRRLFKIAYDLIETVPELLAYLITRHMEGRMYPRVLDQFLITRFSRQPALARLPLSTIIPSKSAFFHYLQDEWARFLRWQLRAQVGEGTSVPYLQERMEEVLPFDHEEIRYRIDSLFLEGFLTPVLGVERASLPFWARVGVVSEVPVDPHRRLQYLLQQMEKEADQANDHSQWQAIAPKLAEIEDLVLTHESELSEESYQTWWEIRESLNKQFEEWLYSRFSTLINLPYHPHPVMLHQVPHYIASHHDEQKLALIVLDGMNWVSWVSIRHFLAARRKKWSFTEQSVFAWIPTLTSLSRQALFAGEIPLFFSESWQTTAKEEKLWQRFWENRGLYKIEVGYRKGLGEEDLSSWIEEMMVSSRVLGLVVQTIDDMAHGVTQGMAGLRTQLEVWLQRGYLLTLIDHLLYNGFNVYLTSDHGQVECRGRGRIEQGILAETRGHRARIYKDALFRNQAAEKHAHALVWPPIGLPVDVFPLLAKGRSAFTTQRGRILAHGGISIDEVLVPLVKVVDRDGKERNRF